MKDIYKLINLKSENPELIKKFCFINNIRSKYLTIGLLILALILTSHDVVITQKTKQFHFFLSQFKTDLILLVSSVVFTIYIFFNQVKSYKEVTNQHKFIHGLISLFFICWSVVKTTFYLSNGGTNIYFLIASIFIVSILYVFPFYIYFSQILFTIFLFSIFLLFINMEMKNVLIS